MWIASATKSSYVRSSRFSTVRAFALCPRSPGATGSRDEPDAMLPGRDQEVAALEQSRPVLLQPEPERTNVVHAFHGLQQGIEIGLVWRAPDLPSLTAIPARHRVQEPRKRFLAPALGARLRVQVVRHHCGLDAHPHVLRSEHDQTRLRSGSLPEKVPDEPKQFQIWLRLRLTAARHDDDADHPALHPLAEGILHAVLRRVALGPCH